MYIYIYIYSFEIQAKLGIYVKQVFHIPYNSSESILENRKLSISKCNSGYKCEFTKCFCKSFSTFSGSNWIKRVKGDTAKRDIMNI